MTKRNFQSKRNFLIRKALNLEGTVTGARLPGLADPKPPVLSKAAETGGVYYAA